jgi:hypothetical protein
MHTHALTGRFPALLTACISAGASISTMDYKLSTIKPQTPYSLYMGWKCIADRPQVVISVWDKRGLICALQAPIQRLLPKPKLWL